MNWFESYPRSIGPSLQGDSVKGNTPFASGRKTAASCISGVQTNRGRGYAKIVFKRRHILLEFRNAESCRSSPAAFHSDVRRVVS